MRKREQSLIRALMATLGVFGLLMLSGCRSARVVETERIRTEYVSRVDTLLRMDSVWVHDSVSVTRNGDTVFKERWRYAYKDRYVYKVLTDTVVVRDTIPVVVTQEEEASVDRVYGVLFLIFLLGCVGLLCSVLWRARRWK